jgi:hypothetical protein
MDSSDLTYMADLRRAYDDINNAPSIYPINMEPNPCIDPRILPDEGDENFPKKKTG